MEYFFLLHPSQSPVLCDLPHCGRVADYLQVDQEGCESHVCPWHTTSIKYVSHLPERRPDPSLLLQIRPAA
jgi:hypothetical protein